MGAAVLRGRWLPAVTLASLLLPAGLAFAGPEPADTVDARAWLSRIHAAAQARNYQGTMVFSAGGMLSSSRIAHFAVGDQTYERLESLDGRQRRVFRVNDTVHTVWPQTRVAVIEKRSPTTNLPSSTQAVEPRALDQYELRAEGTDRIAGRDAQVFLLKPRDDLRYAQRLWADAATGLMLRADVIGPNRTVLESVAFSEVEIGVRPQPDAVTQGIRKLEGFRVIRPQLQPVQLESEGWAMDRKVPGFTLASCVKRPLESGDGPPTPPVLQAVFSDGLTHVSLFIEPHDKNRSFDDLAGQVGATSTLRQRRGDYWITVMGDVPAATLQAFVQALERRR
jgi:sigma-E factor negative regulatory protein RseB